MATLPTQNQLDEARHRFGEMLRVWRRRHGWSGKTAAHWAAACPDVLPYKVSSATWTGFELGRARAPAPETFLAFEAMNIALASGEIGAIRDRTLAERVRAATPICDQDGQPWRAGDWFDAFIGALVPPSDLTPPEFDGQTRADMLRANLAARAKRLDLGNVAALLHLMRELPVATPSMLREVEAIFTAGEPVPDAETAQAIELALEAMGDRDTEPG